MSAILDEMYDSIDSDIDHLRVSQEEETGKPFSIDSQEKAIWALRKIRQIETKRSQAHRTADDEIGRIKKWLAEIDEKADRERGFFNSLLREYMFSLREQDPKLKSLNLPGGSLMIRRQQPEYTYNEEQLLPWAKENLPAAVQVKESILKAPIKDYIKETGEVVPGVVIESRPDRFSIELEG